MATYDRFYPCESLGFPAVSNYDYETNIPVRSSNDRDFRWEEVAVDSIYHMKEATDSGSFEDNTFVVDNSITNPTEIHYITTGNVETGSYLGWHITGLYSVYIGISGLHPFSGDLSGQTSDFYTHPLVGNESIGLYYTGGANGPSIISTSLTIGSEGDIIPDNTHQMYLKARTDYGAESGKLLTYIRGWESSAIVGYYDPASGSWQAAEPTGYYKVASSGYSTIRYSFEASGFPAATPTSFDVYVSNIATGTFLTVDDLHLDALLKKNAFIDYIVPTGYVVQITPDLGWHDVNSMFNSATLQNPHLITLGPFAPELANLTDNLDNTVTATVDEEVFTSSLSSNFKKYLWRTLPITPNGQLGAAGLPQRFEYVGSIIDALFSVDQVLNEDTSSTKVILGTKSSTMHILVDGKENYPGLTYPTSTSWKLEINLQSTMRTVTVQGIDTTGSTTSVRDIKLVNKLYEKNTQALWNVFDEHGLIAGVERLPQETNYNYSTRIKDSYSSRSGPNFSGIVNGATRELNLKKLKEAIKIKIFKNQNNIPATTSIQIEVTAYSIRIHDTSFIITEKLLLDPVHETVDLTYLPKEVPIFAKSTQAADIKLSSIELSTFEGTNRIAYRAKMPGVSSEFVELTYQYFVELLFKDYALLSDLIGAINNIKIVNQKLVEATISPLLSGNESTLGLYITALTLSSTELGHLAWSPIYLKKMTDKGYKDYYLTSPTDTLKNTDYYSYVKELKNNTKVFWGAIESDRDRWDAADSKNLGMESIPTLFDPPLSKILGKKDGAQVQIEPIVAWGRNYQGFDIEMMTNNGLTSNLFQPGVAHTKDLMPGIYFTTSYNNALDGVESNIGPVQNNNNFVLFSGQK